MTELRWVGSSDPDDFGGVEKTATIGDYIRAGALEPLVRDTAVRLVQGAGRDDHLARVERLHRFVQRSIDYHREPVEMFHRATVVLTQGGDCDDHVILLGSLAWALKYPFLVEPIGHPKGPGHYTIRVGTPPSEAPSGNASTRWRSYETIIDALPGEHVNDAVRRLGLA